MPVARFARIACLGAVLAPTLGLCPLHIMAAQDLLTYHANYDLATPYYAATYTMEHLNLAPALRKNISFATYNCGHMVYLRPDMLAKMKRDQTAFMEQVLAGARQ